MVYWRGNEQNGRKAKVIRWSEMQCRVWQRWLKATQWKVWHLLFHCVQDLRRYLYKQLQRWVLKVAQPIQWTWCYWKRILSHFIISYFSTASAAVSVEGLHAIVVTDRDGVPVIKGSATLTQTLSAHWWKTLHTGDGITYLPCQYPV